MEEHVTELGVADAGFAVFHAGADAFLGHHHVHRKVLADVAQEIEQGHVGRPIGIVHQPGRVELGIEVQQTGQLLFDAGNIVIEQFTGGQLSFRIPAAGIADETGGAAGEGDRPVSEQLKAAQPQKRHQVAHVQAVRRGIESTVQGEVLFFVDEAASLRRVNPGEEPESGFIIFRQLGVIASGGGAGTGEKGSVGYQTAPLEFVEDVHQRPELSLVRSRRTRRFWVEPGHDPFAGEPEAEGRAHGDAAVDEPQVPVSSSGCGVLAGTKVASIMPE